MKRGQIKSLNIDVPLDFPKIFECITSPLCIAEPKRPNNLVYVNKAYCDLTGYPAEELIGTNPGKLLQEAYPALLPFPYISKRDYMRKKLDAHEPIDVLIRNFRKDGTSFWNGLHVHPVMDEGQCIYWVGIASDVTEYVESLTKGLEAVIQTMKDNLHQMKSDLRQI